MKYTLIISANKYLLCSDEKIMQGNYARYNSGEIVRMDVEINTDNLSKIIAGHSTLPSIDFTSLNKEECDRIGYVDVDVLANNYAVQEHGIDNNKQYQRGYSYNGFIEGYNSNKNKYSEDDLIKAIDMAVNWQYQTEAPITDTIIQSLHNKVFNVEIEMEDKIALDGHTVIGSEPKIHNNSIKILKVL